MGLADVLLAPVASGTVRAVTVLSGCRTSCFFSFCVERETGAEDSKSSIEAPVKVTHIGHTLSEADCSTVV
jgi:hypothetical protein